MIGLNHFLRWMHVLLGLMWIGHFFALHRLHAALGQSWDAGTQAFGAKIKPRAFAMLRFSGLAAWLFGAALIGLVYHGEGGYMSQHPSGRVPGNAAAGMAFVGLFAGAAIYDFAVARLRGAARAGAGLVLLAVWNFVFANLLSGRALVVHSAALLATVLLWNTWVRMWPAQRAALAAKAGGPQPGVLQLEMLAARSTDCLVLSLPALVLMEGWRMPSLYASQANWLWATLLAAVLGVVGWGASRGMSKPVVTAATKV